MSTAADLIAGLQAQAEYDSDGGFSLDRDKAREKMRQFQLADPHRYVVLLVECATLRGASKIEFEIDADDMHMRCDAVLEWADLDELYTSLFLDLDGRSGSPTPGGSAGIRARRELALACNAVMALNPKFVEITSFGSNGGVRARLRPDQPDEITKLEGARPNGTTIHVKERFRPGLLVRFMLDNRGTLPEELILRERCKTATVEITLDGVRISAGLPEDLVAAVSFVTDDLRGVGGMDPNRADRSGIVLLSNGVEVATHVLTDSVPGLWFWVDGRALRKDVSQNDIARGDPSYTAMLATIAGVRDRVLGQLAKAWQTNHFTAETKPSADDVFKLLSRCFMRWATHEWLRPDAGPLGLLTELPLWRTTDERWLDSRAVSNQAIDSRGVLYSTRNYEGVVIEGWGPVLHPWSGDAEIEAIQRVFVEAHDATTELGRKVPAELARRRWRGCPHEPRLPQGLWPVRLPFLVDEHRGEVSLRPGRQTNVRVIIEGCLLHEVEFEGPLIGIAAVIEGPYAPLADFSRAQLDATFAKGLLILLGQIPALLAAWANVHGHDAGSYVRSTSITLSDPSLPARWLEAFGFKAGAAMVARLGAPVLLPRFALEHAKPNAIAEIVRFETIDRRKVSLVELERERHGREYQRGKLLVVDPDAPYVPDLAMLVIRANPEDRRLLGAVFGESNLHDDTATLQGQLSRQEFVQRPVIAPTRPQPSTWAILIQHGDIQGFVALDAAGLRSDFQRPGQVAPDSARRIALVDIVFEQRLLGQLELPAALPGVRASLSWPSATVNPTWTGVAGSLVPLIAALEHGLAELIREQAERCIALRSRPAGDIRRLIWAAMLAPFSGPEQFAAWQWFRTHEADIRTAIASYWPVFELVPTYDADMVDEAISLLCSDDRAPTHAALVDLLGEAKRTPPALARPVESDRFERRMLELAARLEQLPMFETAARKTHGLADVIAAFTRTGNVAWIQDQSLTAPDDSELIIQIDVGDRAGLIRLFGEDALSEASPRLRELQQRAQFSTRDPLAAIELAGRDRLVAVEFTIDGFEGQLAIPPWPPSEAGVMTLTICHQRRPIEPVEIHATLPVLGIVDDAHVEFEEQFVKVARGGARMAALRKRIDEVLNGQLLPRLAASFTELAPGGRTVAWAWITLYWLRMAEGAGDQPNRLDELGRRFATLPGFVDIDGQPRTLDELIARYQASGTLYTLDQPATTSTVTSEPVLLVRDGGGDQAVIPRLFARRTDYAPLLRDAAEGQARFRKAAPAPSLAAIPDPASVLQRTAVDQLGLAGAVWLPCEFPFESGITMASRGRVVERLTVVSELPIQGLVVGEVGSDRRFSKAELTSEQLHYLVGRVVDAYSQLIERVRQDLDHPDRVDLFDPEQARRRGLRIDSLRVAAIALARAHARGTESPATADLRERLIEIPLLRLTTGRLISIAVGRQSRPIELNHLELWEPPDPAGEKFERELYGALVAAGAEIHTAPEPEPSEPEPEAKPVEPSEPVVPVVPPPDPVDQLLEAIRNELRLVRQGHESLLAEGLLDKIRAEPGRGRGALVKIDGAVVFDSKHPCFEQALEQPDDPVWTSFLASVAYTALNHWQVEVTDSDELKFHARHASFLVSGVLAGMAHISNQHQADA